MPTDSPPPAFVSTTVREPHQLSCRELGTAGERYAEAFLAQHKFRILDRNWRCRIGEIDIICVSDIDDVLAFVEVKTRTSTRFGSGAEAITAAKMRRLRMLAELWLEHHPHAPMTATVRIDVIAVTANGSASPDIEHIRGAW